VRLEEKRNNIKVTIICPGHVETEIQKQSLGADGKAFGQQQIVHLGFEVPLDKAIRIMIDATANEEGQVIYTHSANILCRLRAAFPVFFDKYLGVYG